MSSGGVRQGAIYSPLPQSVGDSDTSEEELHTSIVHQSNSVTYRKTVSPNYSLSNGQNMGEYRPLGYEGQAERSNGSSLTHQNPTTREDVRIIKPDDEVAWRMQPMSPIRTFFFGFSIFLCFFTVIVFLWVLPCDLAECPDTSHKVIIKSWERVLNRLELKGSISVVPGVQGKGKNLVIMGRCKIVSEETDDNEKSIECSDPRNEGGLVSLVGSSGAVAWWKPLEGLPRELDCSLLDMNSDGAEDCIVVGSKGLLASIDPITGTLLWKLQSNSSIGQVFELDFPLTLPDLDGDGINELTTSCSMTADPVRDHNNLILIAGKTGNVMGWPFKLQDCVRVHSLSLNEFLNMSYVCQDSTGKEVKKLISIKELYSMIMNRSNLNLKNLKVDKLRQHKSLGRTKRINGATKTYSYDVNGRRLTLENRGRCPIHCGVTVRVMDLRSGVANEMVWNYTAENMYAMVPATLMFNNRTLANGTVLTEPISGFVLKFWQWSYVFQDEMREESATSSNPMFRSRLRRSSKWQSRFLRSIMPQLKHNTNTSIHQLKERVVLITFNVTDMHIVNASQNEVIQLCIHSETSSEMTCQPDLEFQEQSLLIADLDQDKSQELVSYYTTYVSTGADELSGPWRLQSKVRAIRLEAELPKLYEAVSRQ